MKTEKQATKKPARESEVLTDAQLNMIAAPA